MTTEAERSEAGGTPASPVRSVETMEETHDPTANDATTLPDAWDSAMSFRAMCWVHQLTGLSWAERGILNKLAGHANKAGGSAYPSIRAIAEHGSVEPRSVQRIINKLLEAGFIVVEGEDGRRKGGRSRATSYRIAIPDDYDPGAKGDKDVTLSQKDDNSERVTLVSPEPERVTKPVRKRVTLVSPQSVLPPSEDNRSVLTHRPQGGRPSESGAVEGGRGSENASAGAAAPREESAEEARRRWEQYLPLYSGRGRQPGRRQREAWITDRIEQEREAKARAMR